MPPYEGSELTHSSIFDEQVSYKDTEESKLHAIRNNAGISDANKEESQPDYCYAINKAVPHSGIIAESQTQGHAPLLWIVCCRAH
ncbi:hypothetical protein ES703_54390 [subsurface metagenome]